MQLVCTVPLVFVFACYKIIPESPRWLVSRGRTAEARVILEEIADKNKVPSPDDMSEKLVEMAEETKEVSLGFLSLFSSWTLAIRFVIVAVVAVAAAVTHTQRKL